MPLGPVQEPGDGTGKVSLLIPSMFTPCLEDTNWEGEGMEAEKQLQAN